MAKSKIKKPVVSPPVRSKQNALFFESLEARLAKKRKLIIGLILTIAVLFRISYFIQLNNGPCVWQHRFVESDMNFYDEWAKLIAHGDWLSDRSLHQYTAVAQWIADEYFRKHPEEAIKLQKQLANDKSSEAMGKLLWQKWDGGKMYHQDPLYIYIVAVVYKTFGEDVRNVFVLQMLIGIFSVLLIYLITLRHFGNLAALIAGIMAACCGPLMFYELVLVRESLIVFAGLLLVFLMDKALKKSSTSKLFMLGAVNAFCILLKSIFFLFLLLTVVLLFFTYRKQIRQFLIYSAVYLAGALTAYSPLLIRNAIVGVPLFSQNSVGALTAIAANDVDYDPSMSYVINVPHAAEILGNTGGKTLPAIISSIKTHPNIRSYFNLELKKLALVFHWYEFPNNKNFYYYRLHAPVLWFSFVNLLIIAPLGLIGIFVAIYQKRKLWSLYLLLLMHLFLLVAFLVFSRYRIPFEATMIPFGGFVLAEIIKNARTKIVFVLIMIVGIAIMFYWVDRPLPKSITLIRGMDYQQPYYYYYKPIIDEQLKKNDFKGAEQTMNKFMKFEPDDVKRINSNTVSINNYEITLIGVFRDFHKIYAAILAKSGDMQASKIHDDRANELYQIFMKNDNSGTLNSYLNNALAAPIEQRPELLNQVVVKASNEIKLNPNNKDNYTALANAYAILNRPDSAIAALRQVLRIDSTDYTAVFHLGTLYGRYLNDVPNALYFLEKARAMDMSSEEVYVNLGVVYNMAQKKDKAIEMMYKAAEINPNNMDNLNNLQLILRSSGRIKEADDVKKKIHS